MNGDEAIRSDQETTSTAPGRIRLFYPRGQTQTVLAWLCDQNPPHTATADASVDNGFTQWVKRADGNYANPTDRPDGSGGVVLGLGL